MTTIKYAGKEDVKILYDLILGIAKYSNQEQFVVTTREELLISGFGDDPKFGVLLAYSNNEVAGYLSFTWNYSIWLGGHYLHIDDVFVWEQFRGQKIGEALMNEAKAICQKKGIGSIRWEVQTGNINAIKFYNSLGAEMTTKGIFRWSV